MYIVTTYVYVPSMYMRRIPRKRERPAQRRRETRRRRKVEERAAEKKRFGSESWYGELSRENRRLYHRARSLASLISWLARRPRGRPVREFNLCAKRRARVCVNSPLVLA